jgi:glycosyltransferase involved in cell wall biosynthesis
VHVVLGRLTARCCDLLFAPSERTAVELRRDYGARSVVVLPNVTGAALEGRSTGPSGPRGAGSLLFVGRLRVRKGVEVLLSALARAAAEAPDIELQIVGDGERRRALERTVERLGVAQRVRFRGRLGAREVHDLLRSSRALVVPSTYEGMPLVVLEAMEASCPVVASAVSGIPEVVVDGVTGWLVPPEDVDALASALLAAWRDPEQAARRGRLGRERLEQSYRPSHAAAAWLAAVSERGRRAAPRDAAGVEYHERRVT